MGEMRTRMKRWQQGVRAPMRWNRRQNFSWNTTVTTTVQRTLPISGSTTQIPNPIPRRKRRTSGVNTEIRTFFDAPSFAQAVAAVIMGVAIGELGSSPPPELVG